MDTGSSKEKLHVSPSGEALKSPEKHAKPEASKDVKKKTSEVLSGDLDAAEGSEGAEVGGEKVSEEASEDKSHAPQASGKRTYTTDEIEVIRAKLLAALPPQDVMIRQIKKKLGQEQKVLTKKMKTLKGKAHKHAFELTIVIAQLRKVREFFSILAHATFDMVKHLWLKIVHGV